MKPKYVLQNQLREFRAKEKLTQEALAAKCGVARKTINVIEAGNYAPSVLLALTISQALHTTVEELFYLTEQPIGKK